MLRYPAARLSALALGLLVALCGCSGTGAPRTPTEVAALQSISNDHLTSVLLIKHWFAIMYVRHDLAGGAAILSGEQCDPGYQQVPLQPGDPPGSTRWRGLMSDCTAVDLLYLPDSSGSRTMARPDDQDERSMTWGPPRREGSWVKQGFAETLWDGSTMEYEAGYNTASTDDEQYLRGTASLPDRRTMDFDMTRTTHHDSLTLAPDDGSGLEIEVPVHSIPGAVAWPTFTEGADGTHTRQDGSALTFRIASSGPDRWERWEFRSSDGFVGQFALADRLGGAGSIRQSGQLRASLCWDADGEGTLQPVSASAIPAIPSAAARDFAVDEWIGDIVTLGPMPLY